MTFIAFEDIKVGDVFKASYSSNKAYITYLCVSMKEWTHVRLVVLSVDGDEKDVGLVNKIWPAGTELTIGRSWFNSSIQAVYIGNTSEDYEEAKNAARTDARA